MLLCSLSFVVCSTGDVSCDSCTRSCVFQSLVLADCRGELGTTITTAPPYALTCQHKCMMYARHEELRGGSTGNTCAARGTSFDCEISNARPGCATGEIGASEMHAAPQRMLLASQQGYATDHVSGFVLPETFLCVRREGFARENDAHCRIAPQSCTYLSSMACSQFLTLLCRNPSVGCRTVLSARRRRLRIRHT